MNNFLMITIGIALLVIIFVIVEYFIRKSEKKESEPKEGVISSSTDENGVLGTSDIPDDVEAHIEKNKEVSNGNN